MGAFLKENWIWIVTPMVLVVAAIVYLLMTGGDEGDAKYIYNLW